MPSLFHMLIINVTAKGIAMDNQKLETQLQMALSLPESVRQETMDLNVGYDDADERWTLLIRYVGDILAAESDTVQITVLLGGYAVVVLPQEEIEAFSALPQEQV